MSHISVDIDLKIFSELLLQMKPHETFSALCERLTSELRTERSMRENFQRYVPASVLEQYAPTLFAQKTLSDTDTLNNQIVPEFDEEMDDSLKIRLQKIEGLAGCLVLYLVGYIDIYNSDTFQKRVAKAIEAGFIRLIFDIAGTEMVSSAEIGCYTAFLKAVKPRGGDLVLLQMNPKVYQAYQLLGFGGFFNIKETLDEAIGFFADFRGDENSAKFPWTFKCPVCSKKLRASTPGRLSCSKCNTMLAIDNAGGIFLG